MIKTAAYVREYVDTVPLIIEHIEDVEQIIESAMLLGIKQANGYVLRENLQLQSDIIETMTELGYFIQIFYNSRDYGENKLNRITFSW